MIKTTIIERINMTKSVKAGIITSIIMLISYGLYSLINLWPPMFPILIALGIYAITYDSLKKKG
jgi:CHASE2 domain-containing sensor protein